MQTGNFVNIKTLGNFQSGLVMLMEPTVLYSARFHSMSINIQKDKHEQQIVWKFTFNAKTVHDITAARQTGN